MRVHRLDGKTIVALLILLSFLVNVLGVLIVRASTAPTPTVVSTIDLGYNGMAAPWADVYDSGKGEIFVADDGNGRVSVISDVTNSVVTTWALGSILSG